MFKKIILAFLFLFLVKNSFGQLYHMENLNVENGLSNNYVLDIVQDKRGFLWIATEAGLNRFDGYSFISFNSLNSKLKNAEINSLFYDTEDDLLWIGTKENLSIMKCSTLELDNYDMLDDVILKNITDISLGKNNRIWITTHHEGVVCYDKKSNKVKLYNSSLIENLPNYNWCSYEDDKGYLYIGHGDKGLSVVNLKNLSMERFMHDPLNPNSIPGDKVYTINSDRQGNLWIGTNQGLALFNSHKSEFIVFKHNSFNPSSLAGNKVYNIKEMNDGTLWIASDIGGISILDLYNIDYINPENVEFINIIPSDDNFTLSSGNIRSLFQDSFNNIWVGNYSVGLDFISHSRKKINTFSYYYVKGNKIRNKSIKGIWVDSKEQLWLGSKNEVTIWKETKLLSSFSLTSYTKNYDSFVYSIVEDSQGDIYLGMDEGGLFKYNYKKESFNRIDNPSKKLEVQSLFIDNNKLWIGSKDGLYSYVDGVFQEENFIDNIVFARSIMGIAQDIKGNLWIGTFGGGLYLFDKNKTFKANINASNGFSNSISQISNDSKEGIWIGTRDAGLFHFPIIDDIESFVNYGKNEGLTDLFIRSIQEDSLGNIWFSTNNNLFALDRNNNLMKSYDYKDGLPIGNFSNGSSAIDSNGIVYFGSLGGVCYFNPKELLMEEAVAPVQIVNCKVYNKQLDYNNLEKLIFPLDNKVELNYNQNSFSLSFSVPDFSQSKHVEYAYQVEGLENQWSNILKENQVTFRSLPPGKYVFNVKARLKNQDWDDENMASMTVLIHPPFWMTWYAKLVYFLISTGIIYFIIRSYKRKLKLKGSLEIERRNNYNEQLLNEERMRFYTNIAHELRSPLTLILGPLEDLTEDSQIPGKSGKKIKMIYNSANQLLDLVNQILEFRKMEPQNKKLTVAKEDIARLVTEIGLRYKELNRNPDLKFTVVIEVDSLFIYFDSDVVTTILNNLLSNAFKYTSKGRVTLSLSLVSDLADEYVEIQVSDTGYGIAEEVLPYIFDRYYQAKGKHQASGTGIGLALAKSLAVLHKGELRVKSVVGEGSTFTFRLLANAVYSDALHKEQKQYHSESLSVVLNKEKEDEMEQQPLALVVEDNIDIREYIVSSLSSEYKVFEANNGKEGLQIALDVIPNVIVSDIMMPEMDGTEFCRAIKRDVRTNHIPVILLTAKDSIQDKEKGYESGADSYLTKPFSAKLLRSRINNLLKSREELARLITTRIKGEEPISLHENIGLSNLDQQFLEKVVEIIEDNLDNGDFDVSYIAEKVYMSNSTLYRKIKGLTGVSTNEFIRKIRLKHSLKLLQSGDYNVTESAYMTGFNNMAYYRECFKKEYGVLPSEYLK